MSKIEKNGLKLSFNFNTKQNKFAEQWKRQGSSVNFYTHPVNIKFELAQGIHYGIFEYINKEWRDSLGETELLHQKWDDSSNFPYNPIFTHDEESENSYKLVLLFNVSSPHTINEGIHHFTREQWTLHINKIKGYTAKYMSIFASRFLVNNKEEWEIVDLPEDILTEDWWYLIFNMTHAITFKLQNNHIKYLAEPLTKESDCAICGDPLLGPLNKQQDGKVINMGLDRDVLDDNGNPVGKEQPDEVVIMYCCGNGFHKRCIDNALKPSEVDVDLGYGNYSMDIARRCPLCRKDLSGKLNAGKPVYRKAEVVELGKGKETVEVDTVTAIRFIKLKF